MNHKLEKKLLMVLGPLMLLAPLSVDMYVPFMPELATSFQSSGSLLQMTITLPLLVMGFGQIFWGVVCDKVGRIQALYLNLSLYVLSCLACYYFASINLFIAARVFQAFAVCGGQVMTLSLVRDLTQGHQTQRLFSRLLGISGTAPIVAPYLGALLSDVSGSWRSIFIFLSCYALFCMAILPLLPYQKATEKNLDKKPFSLMALATDLKEILSQQQFRRWIIVPMLVMTGLFLFVAMSTHYLQTHYHVSKQGYALILAVNSLFFLASSFAAAYVNQCLGDKRSIQLGLVGIMLASAMHAGYWVLFGQSMSIFLASVFLCSTCYGIINGAGVRLALEGCAHHIGLATSVLGFLQFAAASIVATFFVQPPIYSPGNFIMVLFTGAFLALVQTHFFSEKIPQRQPQA